MPVSEKKKGMVWFVGAGPGDPELITVKGQRLIREADLIVYAGSLVPEVILSQARPGVETWDSAGLTLEETHALLRKAVHEGKTVVRLHTGDASIYGAVREQKNLLDAEGIASAIVPGVTAAFAAAAAAGVGFTVPEAVQSLTICRLHGRTPVPEGQRVSDFARHGGSLAIYLSAGSPDVLQAELRDGGVAEDTPLILAKRVGWPDERVVASRLSDLAIDMQRYGFERQTVVLVLPGELQADSAPSRLYDAAFSHGFRK